MGSIRQAVSESIDTTLQTPDELMNAIRLSQYACQRLQDLSHGERYAEAHDICRHLHEVRLELERLQQSLDAAIGQAEAIANTPAPAAKPKRTKHHHASHYNYNGH